MLHDKIYFSRQNFQDPICCVSTPHPESHVSLNIKVTTPLKSKSIFANASDFEEMSVSFHAFHSIHERLLLRGLKMQAKV